MYTHHLKYILFLFIGAFATLSAQLSQVTVNVGHMIAGNLDNQMTGLAGSSVGQDMAERVGDIVYTGTSTIDGTERVNGTNDSGTISATVTVTTSGSYSGSFTAGVEGVLSGSIGQELAQSESGTRNMSVTWETQITADGFLRISYTVAVGQESRHGAFLLAIKTELFRPPNENQEPDSDSTDDHGYWFEDHSAEGDTVPDAEVIMHDIEYIFDGEVIMHDIEYISYYYDEWVDDDGEWDNEEE